jgi:hypothetical protein
MALEELAIACFKVLLRHYLEGLRKTPKREQVCGVFCTKANFNNYTYHGL